MNKAFEKILERLEEEKNKDRSGVYSEIQCDVIKFTYGSAKEIVQEVAEEYNGGWIPIEEKLPPDDKYILLSFFNFSIPIVGRYEEYEDGSGNFFAGDEDETLISQNMYVNAWQPLPEPYKDN